MCAIFDLESEYIKNTLDVFTACVRLHVTFDREGAQVEAAAGVGVRGDEEEVVADSEGGNVGGQLRKKRTEMKIYTTLVSPCHSMNKLRVQEH